MKQFSVTFTTITIGFPKKNEFDSNDDHMFLSEKVMGNYGLDMLNIIREDIGEKCNISDLEEACSNVHFSYSIFLSEEEAVDIGRFGGRNAITVLCKPLSFTKYFKMDIKPVYRVFWNHKRILDRFFHEKMTKDAVAPYELDEMKKNKKIIIYSYSLKCVKINWIFDDEWILDDWKNAGYPLNWKVLQ